MRGVIIFVKVGEKSCFEGSLYIFGVIEGVVSVCKVIVDICLTIVV